MPGQKKVSSFPQSLIEHIEVWQGDICDPDSLKGFAKGVDYVVHLAAEGHVAAISDDAYKQFVRINVTGLENVMNECAAAGVKKIIHFS